MNNALHTALGAVRESAQAAEHLSRVTQLRGMRQAAVLQALSEARESCAGVLSAFLSLKPALCARLDSVPEAARVARELFSGGVHCLEQMSELLLSGETADAREQRSLSELVERRMLRLNSLSFLIAQLARASQSQHTMLDAVDVLQTLEAGNDVPFKIALSATIVGKPFFMGDPHLVAGMIRLAVSLAVGAGEQLPHLDVTPFGDAWLGLSVGGKELAADALGQAAAERRRSLVLSFPLLERMPQDEAVLRAVSLLAGIAFEAAPDVRRMRFLLSRTDTPCA